MSCGVLRGFLIWWRKLWFITLAMVQHFLDCEICTLVGKNQYQIQVVGQCQVGDLPASERFQPWRPPCFSWLTCRKFFWHNKTLRTSIKYRAMSQKFPVTSVKLYIERIGHFELQEKFWGNFCTLLYLTVLKSDQNYAFNELLNSVTQK